MDAKNILPRLREGEEDGGGGDKGEDEIEAFQQIMFSDRIVVNKVRVGGGAWGGGGLLESVCYIPTAV